VRQNKQLGWLCLAKLGKDSAQQTLTLSGRRCLNNVFEVRETGPSDHAPAGAPRLGAAPPSVTGMRQGLASVRPALVSNRKHHGVLMRRKWRRAARQAMRPLRRREARLAHALRPTRPEVHGEAHRLQRVTSEALERRTSNARGTSSAPTPIARTGRSLVRAKVR
jgi:Mn-dependent DtxR family transcriptional regulator